MFFSKPMAYDSTKIFSIQHLIILTLTIIAIVIAVKYTKTSNKKSIKKIICIITIVAWILEIIKIIFNIKIGNGSNLNTYIPLYYCSIMLYAGIFSSIGKGFLKRIGDVFLATGGIVGGVLFLVFPTTSITMYPIYHFISIQSFIYHGAMIYLGIIINKLNYITIEAKDIKYYAYLLFVMCLIAYIVNLKSGSNLMFISRNFPGTPIELIYRLTGKCFTFVASLIQITLPFYTVLGIKKILKKIVRYEVISWETAKHDHIDKLT